MPGITIYEFDALVADVPGVSDIVGLHSVPPQVFAWLESQALRAAEAGKTAWLRLFQRRGRRAVKFASFVGVIRAPDGYQIEVLPKVARSIGGGDVAARKLLIEMLRCLAGFRHIQIDSAKLMAARMPLLEVFIGEFLRAVAHLVKRGLRSDYNLQQDNRFVLRGKLHVTTNLRRNLCRRDRFFTEFDEFSPDRAENRLIHAALHRALAWTSSHAHQQLARELRFVFAEIPASQYPSADFKRIRQERGMSHYSAALAWARLMLNDESPLTGAGDHRAPSLLFPMEAVFEAFVTKHLRQQLEHGLTLSSQTRKLALVRHLQKDWFRLQPDILVQASKVNRLVLDTKWKLIDERGAIGSEKYGLAQGDFYQLYAYGQNYLDGNGEVVLIYPRTNNFRKALPEFVFSKSPGLRLWVLPFCLKKKRMLLPKCGNLDAFFVNIEAEESTV